MKTLRALLFGSVVGTLIGYLFAPRHADLLRAELMEREGQRRGAGTGAAGTTTPGGTTSTTNSGGMSATGRRSGARKGAIIGNTHTGVYHQAGDANLPEEENRAYFATAEEAEAAGYRASGHTAEAR